MTWQLHTRRPSIFAVVIGGSLVTFALNLYISQGVPSAQQLAMQWGPIPLDLSGNLLGLELRPSVLVIFALRVALSAWAICILLNLPFRIRALVRAGMVYLAAGAMQPALGLAIFYAWDSALVAAERDFMPGGWLWGFLLGITAILLVGAFTPVLARQFMEVSIGSAYRDPRHWTMAAFSYLIWSAGIYISFFWPVAVGYGLAFVLLSIQSLIVGAILIGVVGWSELPERPPTPAAAESG